MSRPLGGELSEGEERSGGWNIPSTRSNCSNLDERKETSSKQMTLIERRWDLGEL